jgi:hypothetical protein
MFDNILTLSPFDRVSLWPVVGSVSLWIGCSNILLCVGQADGSKPPSRLPRSPGHHREWLDACKGGKPAGSNFAYGARLTEIVLLGVLALRAGRRIEWAAVNLKAKGVPGAETLIKETYRKGWEIA